MQKAQPHLLTSVLTQSSHTKALAKRKILISRHECHYFSLSSFLHKMPGFQQQEQQEQQETHNYLTEERSKNKKTANLKRQNNP